MRRRVDEFEPHDRFSMQRDEPPEDLGRAVRGQPSGQSVSVSRRGASPPSYGAARVWTALQRAAGNRAVAQLVQVGNAVPNIQRCGQGGCGTRDDEEAGPAAQGVTGQEEEFPSPGQPTVQRAAGDRSGPPAVQRTATFSAGPVHQVNNLADCVVNGTPVGVTWPTLNGAQFWSTAAARAALVRPTLKTTAVAAGGFDVQVDTVPTNTASFDETVLAPGPWRLVTTKATIAAMLPTLTTCTGAGNTRFRAYGNPSDAAMFAANRRHEDHHAADHRAAFNATIAPWDAKLAAAKAGGQKFHGATAADAEAALWAAMGGTPDQIADAFMNQCAAAVVAYHSSPAGGPVGSPTSPGARSHCAISWAKYRNPS